MTQHSNNKDQAGKRRPGPGLSPARKRLVLWIVLAVAAALAVGLLMSRSVAPPPPSMQNATESPQADSLSSRAALASEAVRHVLGQVAPGAQEPKVVTTEERLRNGEPYAFVALRLPPADSHSLRQGLDKKLSQIHGVTLHVNAHDEWEVRVDGVPCLLLRLTPLTPEPAEKHPAKGRLAIVIDDMGEDVAVARDLAALGVPIAFSIWPDSGHRVQVLNIVQSAGKEIFIHLPMQPKGYPKVAPGPHALLDGMTAERIQEVVRRAASRVPGAVAVNNHMGSAFTESTYGMRAALSAIKGQGLFFLDSRTTAKSVGVAEARRIGLQVHQRDVFLDNDLAVPAIVAQLRVAEAAALKHGHAIAIGHPHKQTVAAIRAWLKKKSPSVHVVTVSSLPPQ